MLGKRKVLFVDANSSLTESVGYLLETDGFKVDCCGDGASALDAASKKIFNVVVIDYRLSDMNGADVTKELRKLLPESIIIGQGAGLREEEFLQAGATAYLLKPYGYGNLKDLMKTLSENSAMAGRL